MALLCVHAGGFPERWRGRPVRALCRCARTCEAGEAVLPGQLFLDNADKALIRKKRGPHNQLGFAVQLTSVRYIGRFLADPLDGVPTEVIGYLAEQLGIADASCLKLYAQREPTHREHAGQIQTKLGTAWAAAAVDPAFLTTYGPPGHANLVLHLIGRLGGARPGSRAATCSRVSAGRCGGGCVRPACRRG
ncbi:DUF4158 domain-containing protein [Nonomuraea sp. NPDC050383]|uniref:DUF4158 domain-containing protein n=1 Tax=Nonomuraea sp. NPDC050383 TaxID=3364362 RepID=UPI0037A97329